MKPVLPYYATDSGIGERVNLPKVYEFLQHPRLWTLMVLSDYSSGGSVGGGCGLLYVAFLPLSCFVLFMLGVAIACVRTRDYYYVTVYSSEKFNVAKSVKAQKALSVGKVKQKMESCGIATSACLSPSPFAEENVAAYLSGLLCMRCAIFYAWKSLLHKLKQSANENPSEP